MLENCKINLSRFTIFEIFHCYGEIADHCTVFPNNYKIFQAYYGLQHSFTKWADYK